MINICLVSVTKRGTSAEIYVPTLLDLEEFCPSPQPLIADRYLYFPYSVSLKIMRSCNVSGRICRGVGKELEVKHVFCIAAPIVYTIICFQLDQRLG